MKKRLLVVAPAALAVALSTGVGPASAAANNNGNANCIGREASGLNVIGSRIGSPGLGGMLIVGFAQDGGAGDRATERDFCE